MRFRQGLPVFNTVVRGDPLNSGPRNLAFKRRSPLSYGVDILTDDYYILSQSMRLPDRRRDGLTERP